MRLGNGELEEELIKIMQEIDAIRAQIQTKESEMAAMQEEWQKKQDELQVEINGIDAAVSEASTRRQTSSGSR